MADKAASFVAHDKGLLVLDDYALAAVTAPTWPGLSFERFVADNVEAKSPTRPHPNPPHTGVFAHLSPARVPTANADKVAS